MEERVYDIWLSGIDGLGPKGQMRLLEIYGSSRKIFEAVENKFSKDLSVPQQILEKCRRERIEIARIGDAEYPARLYGIEDPPLLLYYKGNLISGDQGDVAVVGARKATTYGRWAAQGLGEKLACHEVTVVSGMAYGIDSCAHRGALSAGGRTFAVLGCGVDICYPPSHSKLMEEIIESGAVLSEFPPGTPPAAYNFPRRNRIISGISKCVVVVEAGLGSGSLITADFALEQGRDVYAVPGNINCICSIGTNKLIREGATPLVRIDDILDELKIRKKQDDEKINSMLGKDEEPIYLALKMHGELTVDQLSQMTGKPVREMRPLVSILEIKGIVESAQGKIFIAK